ncbi:MAG TPA: hypothetical protein VKN18_14465 [Blastocatellia bacterium]|nr:hypothetical protein [Blastocatellia bacterium]
MSHAVLSRPDREFFPVHSGPRLVAILVFASWLALVILLGAREVFVAPRGTPPLSLLIAFTLPVAVFLIAYWMWPGFREFALKADLRFLTGMQAWRFGGFAFLALFTYAILPGYFAWPAGLGDMAIGLSAPWILVALNRDRNFASSKTFLAWNVFGLLDLVVAVTIGAIGPRLLASNQVGAVNTSVMAHLPLVLVPGYLVPMFIIFHLTALFQARRFAGKPSECS